MWLPICRFPDLYCISGWIFLYHLFKKILVACLSIEITPSHQRALSTKQWTLYTSCAMTFNYYIKSKSKFVILNSIAEPVGWQYSAKSAALHRSMLHFSHLNIPYSTNLKAPNMQIRHVHLKYFWWKCILFINHSQPGLTKWSL